MFINYGKSLMRQTDWESSRRSPLLPLDSAHAVRNRGTASSSARFSFTLILPWVQRKLFCLLFSLYLGSWSNPGAQAGWELAEIFLSRLPRDWDSKCDTPCPAFWTSIKAEYLIIQIQSIHCSLTNRALLFTSSSFFF